ncbi:glycoside hydrolase family 15 protein [Vulgatibacter sp.]|uniref:glycoside hydrolase family 15 protein n=1 Tax=Vulgatibacter sp. TaxID=1971226 RepID=UPI003569DB81
MESTHAFWNRWADRCKYRGRYAEAVQRSALVLKGLTNSTTGAFAAAPTTSLPECIGGERNWDYRYTWLRDSVAVLAVLLSLGYRHEAVEYGRFLVRTAAGEPRDLQIMYGLGGERLLHEIDLEHLEGYRSSRPVRIGNGAWQQLQLDAYGEVLAAAWLFYREHLPGGLSRPSVEGKRFLRSVLDQIAAKWCEPDEGMWEVRSARQHFVFSKLMCWVGLDRGIRLFDALGDAQPQRARWAAVRDEIRAAIESRGTNPETGAFAQAFGSRHYDASSLHVLLRGFLPAGDPRVQATIRAIEEHLTENGHVYRYHGEDGLHGKEGAFTYCTLWLATAHALSGRIDRAEALFEQVLASANDLGLLSEEIDPASGALLGNFPQAFSHVGVIETAFAIEGARAGNYVAPEGPDAPCWIC